MGMSTTTAPSVADLAAATKSDRNRAVDFYRAAAMVAVAVGHWAAIAIAVSPDGDLLTGNALELAPSMSWITWLFQVMPLFFVVGGFSSAVSLDSHLSKNGRPQDWVAARLRRMAAPAIVLAGTWLAIIGVAAVAGVGGLALAASVAAAIPLWFLANYTIDTAIAPWLYPAFRKNPAKVAAIGLGAFGLLEVLRLEGFHTIAQLNWVIGWLLFQVAGFAWREGLLPKGRAMAATAGALWIAAITAVVGPYPMTMVHVPGIENSPTHPPSLALMLFGAAYSATALAAAPRVSKALAERPRAWAAVVAANAISLSVYLWHFTAAVAAAAVLYAAGMLPTADVGTGAWWLQKLPLMGLAAVFLALIVVAVGRFEQRALLAPRTPWNGGPASMLATAALISGSIKLWSLGTGFGVVTGCTLLLAVWFGLMQSSRPSSERSSNRPSSDRSSSNEPERTSVDA